MIDALLTRFDQTLTSIKFKIRCITFLAGWNAVSGESGSVYYKLEVNHQCIRLFTVIKEGYISKVAQ